MHGGASRDAPLPRAAEVSGPPRRDSLAKERWQFKQNHLPEKVCPALVMVIHELETVQGARHEGPSRVWQLRWSVVGMAARLRTRGCATSGGPTHATVLSERVLGLLSCLVV